jgi:hypothetical protein
LKTVPADNRFYAVLPDHSSGSKFLAGIQVRLTQRPIARAKSSDLQSVEHAQHLIRAAAYAKAVNYLVLQHSVWVDDE